MRAKSLLRMGFLSMLAAAAALSASNSFAAGAQRVDVIDSLPTRGQSDSMNTAGHQAQRVDVIESIGSNGPVYPFASGAMRVDVSDSLESQGAVSSSASGTMSVGVIDSLLTLRSQFESVKTVGEKVARVDFIESRPVGAQWDSSKTSGDHLARVDVIDSIKWRGDLYPSTTGTTRVDVNEETGEIHY